MTERLLLKSVGYNLSMHTNLNDYPRLICARDVAPPAGFEACPIIDPFEAYIGPYFRRRDAKGYEFCLPLDDRHLNAMGNAHGGMLMTFADASMGLTAWEAVPDSPVVTLGMNLTFQSAATAGALLRMSPRITRQTRSVLFIEGDLRIDDQIIAGATSIWKILKSRRE